MSDEIDAIVGDLTMGQRAAINHPTHGQFATSIYSGTPGVVRNALRRKGIVVNRMYATALTDLGLAVRARLTKTAGPGYE